MKLFGYEITREKRSVENPQVKLGSAAAWASVFNSWDMGSDAGIRVTPQKALGVPAVAASVNFLSRAFAHLPAKVYRRTENGREAINGTISRLLADAPNEEWSSYKWRDYSFRQTLTEGRSLSWIERKSGQVVGIWPITEPRKVKIERMGGRTFYTVHENGRNKTYEAQDIIDIPFALEDDGLTHISPIYSNKNAIALALAMEKYASKYFSKGGVPPLALEGPLPQGPEGFQRAYNQIQSAVQNSQDADSPVFAMPPGHKLTPVAFDPDKGQMTEGRRFQNEEIARIYGIPPVFVQDLTHGTFSNTEQQDLHLVKHVMTQWVVAWEQELNLKLFGPSKRDRFVKFNLDGLLRGDFASRMDGLSKAAQNALHTPNEGRALLDLPPMANGNELLIQGATVPLGSQETGNEDE